jgi:hypothetical protein
VEISAHRCGYRWAWLLQVAHCLVLLMAEPGENMLFTSYNGMPFDVGVDWLDHVPELGMFAW